MDLSGKNILVVGGSSGIGLSLIDLLDKGGAAVYNVSRSISKQWPAGVHHLPFDISADISSLGPLLPETLHGLVYSVGSINLKPINRISEDDLIQDYLINVVGAVKIIQQSLKSLKNAGGSSVVLIGSVAAKTGMGFHASIAAAKGGLQGLALSLAAELASQNIRVNVISPSLTDTPLAQHLLSTPEKRESSAKRHPLGRIGVPGDIAAGIVFLLSDNSAWMTGQIIGLDGGIGSLKTI